MSDRILVTGASGFIAQHVMARLLQKGYAVRGTLRSLKRADEVRAARARARVDGAGVEFVEADLLADGGWGEAVRECAYVHHVASPFPAAMPKDDEELIRPARDGALRVLKASKAAGVRRVVLTSSMAAIAYGHGKNRPAIVDETLWSNPDGPDNTAYTRSKTIAERAAWNYVAGEGKGLELATVNPSGVLGPALTKDASTSVEIVLQLLRGKVPGTPRLGFAVVDVRDVAECHVAAMTNPNAAGERFLAESGFMWMREIADLLIREMPNEAKRVPKGSVPDIVLRAMGLFNPLYAQVATELGRTRRASNAKAREVLGVAFRTPAEAVLSAAKSVVDLGMVAA